MFLLRWLVNHFLFGGTLFFATGVTVADLTSSNTETTTEEPTESQTDESVESEVEESTEETQGLTEKVAAKEEKVDWRTIPQEVKSHIQEIAKTNPKLSNQLQSAVYTSQTFLKEFPGGLNQAKELKKSIDEAGGVEEIGKMRSTYQALVDEQEALDGKAAAGDISVLDNLIEISGEGFTKLVPAALDRFEKMAPEEYSHMMGKVMVSAMQEGGILNDINMAFQMLGLNNPEATKIGIDALKRAANWINKVGEIAAKAPEKPKTDPKIAEQQQKIDQEKTQIFNDRFAARLGPWRDSEIKRLLYATAPKGRKFNDDQLSVFGDRVVAETKKVLTSDPDYMKNLNRHYDARNMEELFKFAQSRTGKVLPDVVKRVYRGLFTDLRLKAKVVETKPKPGEVKPGAKPPVKTSEGWVKVSPDKAPKPDAIDNTKTTFEMKFRKQAILRDGKKIFWGADAPK